MMEHKLQYTIEPTTVGDQSNYSRPGPSRVGAGGQMHRDSNPLASSCEARILLLLDRAPYLLTNWWLRWHHRVPINCRALVLAFKNSDISKSAQNRVTQFSNGTENLCRLIQADPMVHKIISQK